MIRSRAKSYRQPGRRSRSQHQRAVELGHASATAPAQAHLCERLEPRLLMAAGTMDNSPPSGPGAGGPYVIDEGASLTLNAAAAIDANGDALTYRWDINADNLFNDATGLNPTLTWEQLHRMGIRYGYTTASVRVQASDGKATSTSAPATLQVRDPYAAAGTVIGSVQMEEAGTLSAAVYDAAGQIVRTLLQESPRQAGPVDLVWDGRDDYGNPMPVGDYHWRAVSGNATAVDDGQVGDLSNTPYGKSEHSGGVGAVAVDPAGNVYESSYWEEAHQDLRKWDADGNPLWGVNFVGGGAAVAADDRFVYAAREVSGQNRIERVSASAGEGAPWGGVASGHLVANASGGHGVFGLAVDSTRLWVSNFAQDRVEVYDKATGVRTALIPVTDPRGVAADGEGNVWVAQGGDRVRKYSAAGVRLAEVSGLSDPYAVAVGGPGGGLFIGEVGSGKVREFDATTLAPVRALFGAAAPGPVSDDAFYWRTTERAGIAVDAAGRMVVVDDGNRRVMTYHPDGSVLRTRFSEFQPAPFTDPAVDPDMLLSGNLQYAVDYAPGPNYGKWRLTHNWRPADDQWYSGQAVRRRLGNGRDYLFYFDANKGQTAWRDQTVAVYALEPAGMRRAAIIGSEHSATADGSDRLWNWTDADGDGQVDGAEVASLAGARRDELRSADSWTADGEGDVLIGHWGNATAEMPLRGFDGLGNPLYDWSTAPPRVVAPEDTSYPAFRPTSVQVHPATGELFRVGTTSENRNLGWFWSSGGTAVERLRADGSRVSLLPITPAGMDNDLVTVAPGTDARFFYTGHSGGDQHWVRMYTSDGLLVTTARIGPNNGGHGGWIDHGMGLTAFTHPATGVHYAYAEEVYYGKSIRYRFDGVDTLTRSEGAFRWTKDAFLVTNTNDGGAGSLRQAILNANERPGHDHIRFSIPGPGVHTIVPLSALPAATDAVTIDGTTNPDYGGTPVIELSGAQADPDRSDAITVAGLQVYRGNSTVRGLIVNRFTGAGLQVRGGGSDSFVIEGNYLGVDAAGNQAAGNGSSGLHLQGVFNHGPAVDTLVRGNVISGNAEHGLFMEEVSGALVQGNRIGTNAAGTAAVPNGQSGISLNHAPDNLIGGTAAGAGNLISGNGRFGIGIENPRSTRNRVEGNLIGTDGTGTLRIANAQYGVFIGNAPDNVVGGTEPGAGNVISGSGGGVQLKGSGATGNRVQGNRIGTDIGGRMAVSNGGGGVLITDFAAGNLIGGTSPEARNVISGGTGRGIMIERSARGNVVQGNYIGTDATGAAPLGNRGVGVEVASGAWGNVIGGTAAGAGNVIAYNGTAGVWVTSAGGAGNAVRGNAVHSTAGGLGIELDALGAAANDAGDADVGPNGLQNYPTLTRAAASARTIRVEGTFNSTPDSAFDVDFFDSAAADPSGWGEGQIV